MNRLLSSAFVSTALVCGASLSASAAPLTPSASGAQSSIEKAHSYHRSCDRGHRHQRDGDWVSCGRSYYYRDRSPGVTLYFGTRDRGNWHSGRHYRRDHH